MQFDIEEGRVRGIYEMTVERNKAVRSFTGEISVTFTSEISLTKAEMGSKESTGSCTGEIGVTKPELGNKEATGKITVTKAVLANKEVAGKIAIAKAVLANKEGCANGIDFTKAELVNKEAAGFTKAELKIAIAKLANKVGNGIDFTDKEAAGFTNAELGNKVAAGTGMVTEDAWITFVYIINPPKGIERKTDPTATKERVPDSFMDILRNRRQFQKFPPVDETSPVFIMFPHLLEMRRSLWAEKNTCIALHEDVVKQHARKGFAEVGVDFSDGIKKIFVLPRHLQD